MARIAWRQPGHWQRPIDGQLGILRAEAAFGTRLIGRSMEIQHFAVVGKRLKPERKWGQRKWGQTPEMGSQTPEMGSNTIMLEEGLGDAGFFFHAGGGEQVGVLAFVLVFAEVAELDLC